MPTQGSPEPADTSPSDAASADATPSDGTPVDAAPASRPPLHIIYELGSMTLADFTRRPEAAILLVDTFRGSHHNNEHCTLSILDCNNQALTLTCRDLGHILREGDALDCLKTQTRKARPSSLRDLLTRYQERVTRGGKGVDRLAVLFADKSAPPLGRAPGPALDTGTAVAVVFTLGQIDWAALAGSCSASNIYRRASVSTPFIGLSFVSMLNNEGLLAPSIENTKAQALKPDTPNKTKPVTGVPPQTSSAATELAAADISGVSRL